jgi:hypothetical protein
MVKGFSTVFKHRSESIYFDLEKDPYKSPAVSTDAFTSPAP